MTFEFLNLPKLKIHLMFEKTNGNHRFYADAVQRFYDEASALHPKLLFTAKKYQYGFAACVLPKEFDTYFMAIEASARRNYKKAQRLGYVFRRIDYNEHLDDIRDIWTSTPVRQGLMPQNFLEGRVRPIADPPSRTHYQDYPYFGVFKDNKLVAYAACLVTGELCSLNDLYGHDRYLNDGIVPMLVIEIARECIQTYPTVKYFAYGTYFGASESMRRFKRKFLFLPHRVSWVLSSPVEPDAAQGPMLVYQLQLENIPSDEPLPEGRMIIVNHPLSLLVHFVSWARNWGLKQAVRASLKVMSQKRAFYGVMLGGRIVHSAWANFGFCRYYSVEPESVVLGTLWTSPPFRGKGLAPAAMRRLMRYLFSRGYRRFYVDVAPNNQPSVRAIEKAGFQLQRRLNEAAVKPPVNVAEPVLVKGDRLLV